MLKYEFHTSTRLELLQELHSLASRNVEHVGLEYIEKRLVQYNTVLTARNTDGTLAAFMCSNITSLKTPIPFLRLPMLHFGLSIVDHPYRAQGIARELPRVLIRRLKNLFPIRFLLFGIVLTAKCSSPASFRTIQRATEPLFFPRLNKKNVLSVPAFLTWAIRNVRIALHLEPENTVILAGANTDGQFRLAAESYDETKDRALFRYFSTSILPNQSEVLAFGLWHPIKLIFKLPKKVPTELPIELPIERPRNQPTASQELSVRRRT